MPIRISLPQPDTSDNTIFVEVPEGRPLSDILVRNSDDEILALPQDQLADVLAIARFAQHIPGDGELSNRATGVITQFSHLIEDTRRLSSASYNAALELQAANGDDVRNGLSDYYNAFVDALYDTDRHLNTNTSSIFGFANTLLVSAIEDVLQQSRDELAQQAFQIANDLAEAAAGNRPDLTGGLSLDSAIGDLTALVFGDDLPSHNPQRPALSVSDFVNLDRATILSWTLPYLAQEFYNIGENLRDGVAQDFISDNYATVASVLAVGLPLVSATISTINFFDNALAVFRNISSQNELSNQLASLTQETQGLWLEMLSGAHSNPVALSDMQSLARDFVTVGTDQADTIIGSEEADRIASLSDHDVVFGNAGNDIIDLDGQNLTVVGGEGNDQFRVTTEQGSGPVSGTIDGDSGFDIVYIEGNEADFEVTGTSISSISGDSVNFQYSDIEEIVFSQNEGYSRIVAFAHALYNDLQTSLSMESSERQFGSGIFEAQVQAETLNGSIQLEASLAEGSISVFGRNYSAFDPYSEAPNFESNSVIGWMSVSDTLHFTNLGSLEVPVTITFEVEYSSNSTVQSFASFRPYYSYSGLEPFSYWPISMPLPVLSNYPLTTGVHEFSYSFSGPSHSIPLFFGIYTSPYNEISVFDENIEVSIQELPEGVSFTSSSGVFLEAQNSQNRAPSSIILTEETIDENTIEGSVVGTILVRDPDVSDTHSLILIDDAGGRFDLVDNTLVTASPLNFETDETHRVTVRATDAAGLSVESSFSIHVNNLSETLFGTSDDDSITAAIFDDVLYGLGGNDSLDGGAGSDHITAGFGNDVVSDGDGLDLISLGVGEDIVILSGTTYHTSGYVAFNVSSGTQVGTQVRVNLEGLVRIQAVTDGGADADTVQLSDEGDAFFLHDAYSGFHTSVALTEDYVSNQSTARFANIEDIRGMGGDDIIDLTSPDYSLVGVSMTIYGGEGNDIIWGSDADEDISGGNGDDTIFGGIGADVLSGDRGADVFEFTRTSTNTSVTDFDVGEGDMLRFYNAGGAEFDASSVALTANGITISYTVTASGTEHDISIALAASAAEFTTTLPEILNVIEVL